MCWLWSVFVSVSGCGQVSFVGGSGGVSHAFASCAGLALVFLFSLVKPRTTQAASPVLVYRSVRCLGFFVQGSLAFIVLLGLTWRSKGRAASWRFCSLVFYQALGLRLASVSGTPLSFTLGVLG
ncbi:MAG: hypothetical protein Q8N96_14195 [Methylovulum sp.]|nr:hypothetical protein [Methylovulum sp.]